MPRVKIDYIVSFSSEDPDNQANNLLEWEVSKKKWLCSKGESSCSVVLQLTKAVKIESINIGAHHVASVEVLVGLSEKPNEQFEVLVPTCMLLSPTESRRDAAVERVRSFSAAQLTAARERRWDRLRVVCGQPYNKHCKYGLSFVHVYEPQGPQGPARAWRLDAAEEDEDEFRPGELFAQHTRSQNTSTDAQIRQASMDAIKNMSDKSTKLLKTPIVKTGNRDQNRTTEHCPNREKESLMYTDDDKRPHAKIDQIEQKHKEQKERDEGKKTPNEKAHTNSSKRKEEMKTKEHLDKDVMPQKNNTPSKDSSSTSNRDSNKKRKRSAEEAELELGPVCDDASAILRGVHFTLSGYEQPERGELRALALALGARYSPAWSAACTHLVCAFANTPKLRAAAAGGGAVRAVTGAWMRACAAARRRVPWRCYATRAHERLPARDWADRASPSDPEMDTDDEIEKVLQQQQKKIRRTPPAGNDTSTTKRDQKYDVTDGRDTTHKHNGKGTRDETDEADVSRDVTDVKNSSRDSDVTFVRDERVRGHVTIDDDDTDDDSAPRADEEVDEDKVLPMLFAGLSFTLDELPPQYERGLLERYIRAYGGLVLESSEVLDEDGVYRVSSSMGEGCVSPEWVWRCHEQGKLLPTS